jgi:hypothetical protein
MVLTLGVSYLWDRDIRSGWRTCAPAPLPQPLEHPLAEIEEPASKYFVWDLHVVCSVYEWVGC